MIRKNLTSIALVILLTVSSFLIVFSTVEAQTVSTVPTNLLSYEWPQGGSTSSLTNSVGGPAPDAPNILWKTQLPALGYVNTGFIYAFNGLFFVNNSSKLIALDGGTGKIVWATNVTGGVVKLDDTRMMVGNTCFETNTGKILWTTNQFSIGKGGQATPVPFYSPEEKMFFSTNCAWRLSDPSQPPTLAWNNTGILEQCSLYLYGGGLVYTNGELPIMRAFNATTGKIVWEVQTTTQLHYEGSYYNGMVLFGGLDNNFRAYNATNGAVIWTFNPGTSYGFWASTPAVANGKVYMLNEDTFLYCMDTATGRLIWKYKGPGISYPSVPIVGGGKVYAQTGDATYRDPDTHASGLPEYICLDAETGEVEWRLPVELGAPCAPQCIAYGNLYIVPTFMTSTTALWTRTAQAPEVWCISTVSSANIQDWSMWRSNPTQTAQGTGPTNLQLKWKFQTNGAVSSSATIVNGIAYVGSFDKNIYAINATSGAKIWNFTTGYMVRSSPAVVGNLVYTGADDGNIYCLNAQTGAQVWKTPAGGIAMLSQGSYSPPRSSPIATGGRVYVGSLDQNLYCLDAISGAVLWTRPTNGPVTSSPAIVDGAIYITASTPKPNGTLYKLNANDGSVIWTLGIPYSKSADMHASPTVAAGMVFIPADAANYYGVNATTGSIVWTYTPPAGEGVAVYATCSALYANNKVYVEDFYNVVCLNPANGSVIWKQWLAREVIGSLSYSYGIVYAASQQMAVYALDANTGNKLSSYDIGGQVWSSPTLYNANLYVGSSDWNLYCFKEASSTTYLCPLLTATISTTQINKGESIVISGALSPAIPNKQLILHFNGPSSAIIDISTFSDKNGTFQASYTPETAGSWTLEAKYSGDTNIASASSNQLTLSVLSPQPSPSPTATPTPTPIPTPSPTPSPAQPTQTPTLQPSISPTPNQIFGLPAESTYAIAFIIVIAVIAVLALLLRKRSKR